jgi:hypothetical protein
MDKASRLAAARYVERVLVAFPLAVVGTVLLAWWLSKAL